MLCLRIGVLTLLPTAMYELRFLGCSFGQEYFYNLTTSITTWERPALMVASKSSPAPTPPPFVKKVGATKKAVEAGLTFYQNFDIVTQSRVLIYYWR